MVSLFVELKGNLLVRNLFQHFSRGASVFFYHDLVSALQKLLVVVRVVNLHSNVVDTHGTLIMMLLVL